MEGEFYQPSEQRGMMKRYKQRQHNELDYLILRNLLAAAVTFLANSSSPCGRDFKI